MDAQMSRHVAFPPHSLFFPPSIVKVIGSCLEPTIDNLQEVNAMHCYSVRITDKAELLICI